MLFVVGFHGSLESCERAVYLFVNWNVNLGGSCPEHYNAFNTVLFLEVADVLADLLGHVPAVLYGLHVVAVKTFCIVVVKSGLHGNDLLELVLHGVDVFFLEHLAVDSAFVGVLRIDIPCSEHDVVEISDGYDFVVFQIFFVSSFSYTDFVILGHRANGFCKAFAGHEHTGHEGGSYGSKSNHEDAEFAFSRLYVCFLHDLLKNCITDCSMFWAFRKQREQVSILSKWV